MNRFRTAFATLALFLAVILPLEQAHCAWMGLQARVSAPADGAADHGCCPEARTPAAAPECACLNLPGGSLPLAPITVDAPVAAAAIPAAEAATPVLLPADAPAPALDVGGAAPSPVDLGAHGLRAPPLSS